MVYNIKALKWVFLVSSVLLAHLLSAQPKIDPNGYNVFKYEDGTISSEGLMLDGKPEGFWKTYYPNGELKSEGFRKNFLLDSAWKFYREDGNIESIINYNLGKQNGLELRFSTQGNLIEKYLIEDGNKKGDAFYYYESGELYKQVPFEDNKEQGKGLEFAKDGRIITFLNYDSGYIRSLEKVNRLSKQNQKTGYWVEFYEGGSIKLEGFYQRDLKNGVFKYFNKRGDLEKIEKYILDELITDASETVVLDIRKEFYEDGKIKLVGSYRDGTKQGVFREYDREGNIINSILFENNIKQGEGIVDAQGKYQGDWKLYFRTGELRAEGTYVDGKKEGNWIYFFKEGKVEQKGNYKSDLPSGSWNWFFQDGSTHREDYYRKGKEDGESIEYDREGNLIRKGEYIDGVKMGPWFYQVNDHKEEGDYIDGEKNGVWIFTYDNGQTNFKGEYLNGIPGGKHKYYYRNGTMRTEGKYKAGEKDGDWKTYSEEGVLVLTIKYKGGIEIKLDGAKIKLPEEVME
jgi:uncharacterized protein